MSGILDNKSRIIDVFVTQEGRRQIANGDLKVSYVSFTDTGTFYEADAVSGSSDITHRIFLECSNLPQDQITFEANDAGLLNAFHNVDGITVKNGQILEYSFQATTSSYVEGTQRELTILSGTAFASTAETLLVSSMNNFQNLRTIGTLNRTFDDDGFDLSKTSIEFQINDKRPIDDPTAYAVNINHMESLFNDVRLSKVQNFMYLPPINKFNDDSIDRSDYRNVKNYALGNYSPWGRTHVEGLTYEQLKSELDHFEQIGFCKTLKIDPTSKSNRLVMQMFERSYDRLRKLDVIDFGKHNTGDALHPIAHIFFVGKIKIDNNGTDTFMHLFTLAFD